MTFAAVGLLAGIGLAGCVEDSGSSQSAPESDAVFLTQGCTTAVAAEVGVSMSEVKLIKSVPNGSGATGTVSVLGAEAPWVCEANSSGAVTSVYYGAEG